MPPAGKLVEDGIVILAKAGIQRGRGEAKTAASTTKAVPVRSGNAVANKMPVPFRRHFGPTTQQESPRLLLVRGL